MKIKPFLLVLTSFYIHTALNAQVTELWGTTSEGGDYNSGTIFKTDGYGENQVLQYSFYKVAGKNPSFGNNYIAHPNGNYYGVTQNGGLHEKGILYEFDPVNDSYTKKVDFGGYELGENPRDIIFANGKIYYVSKYSGSGYLIEFDPVTNIAIKKNTFTEYLIHGLIQVSSDTFYGLMSYGGTNNNGTIFNYNLNTNSYNIVHNFDGANGQFPTKILLDTNGNIHGLTSSGGINDNGVLFEFNTSTNTYIKRFDFTDASTGNSPNVLMQANNGLLYGATSTGGATNDGVLFEYNITTNTLTKRLDFNSSITGRMPRYLLQVNNGKLYGVTSGGGANYGGVLFDFDIQTNTFTKLMDFETSMGSSPIFLLQNSSSMLYGTTQYGGFGSNGVIFQFNTATNSYTKMIDFNYAPNGTSPYGNMVHASNGKLYGMTNSGGQYNVGIIFEYDLISNMFTKKFDFDGVNSGSSPYGGLIQANNGKLYGMTYQGGANGKGVLFEYDPETDMYFKKLDFDGSAYGSNPRGTLLEASNNKLYGVTYNGGANNLGALFEYDPVTEMTTKKADFYSTGRKPLGSLIEADNGKFYVLSSRYYDTYYYRGGHLIEFDLNTNTLISKHNFSSGLNLYGGIIQANNGFIYITGNTSYNNYVFKYDLTLNTISQTTISQGNGAMSNLVQTSNDKIYGMSLNGGSNNQGILFEYDVSTDTNIIKVNFNGNNGSHPYPNSKLTLISYPEPEPLTYVPDNNFEQALIDLGHDDVLDDYVATANINTLTNLDVSNKNIADATGLEDFVQLSVLYMDNNNLSSLDVSTLTNLTRLYVSHNPLSTLDVTNNVLLERIYAYFCNLTSFDASMLPNLERLRLNDNQLTSVNASNLTNLQDIHVYNNQLTTLDISNNTALTTAYLDYNQLASIDVSTNTNLVNLAIGYNPLTSINLSGNINLRILTAEELLITSMDLSNNSLLEQLWMPGNTSLTNLNLTNNTAIFNLSIANSGLTDLDLSVNTAITDVHLQNNASLESLNIKNGNNTIISFFETINSPNLTCIEVDDANYATTNWTNIDAGTTFSEDCATLGIQDPYILEFFNLYPNPANSFIQVESNKDIIHYSLRNITGQIIYKNLFESKEIDISKLTSGVYFITFHGKGFQHTKKLIIK